MHEVSSPTNTAAVPGRNITDNTMTLHMVQCYLDGEDIDGFAIMIDWEKCFDLINWDYIHAAIDALGFGPWIQKWIGTLYNKSQPLSRRVLVNGALTREFFITRGIPQGGSECTILQVAIFEGLTRLLQQAPYQGITIPATVVDTPDTIIKMLQYADDTLGLLATLAEKGIFFKAVDIFGAASTSRRNLSKTEGLAMGTHTTELDQGYNNEEIKWATGDQVVTPLGAPFSETWNVDEFWLKIYKKNQTQNQQVGSQNATYYTRQDPLI